MSSQSALWIPSRKVQELFFCVEVTRSAPSKIVLSGHSSFLLWSQDLNLGPMQTDLRCEGEWEWYVGPGDLSRKTPHPPPHPTSPVGEMLVWGLIGAPLMWVFYSWKQMESWICGLLPSTVIWRGGKREDMSMEDRGKRQKGRHVSANEQPAQMAVEAGSEKRNEFFQWKPDLPRGRWIWDLASSQYVLVTPSKYN